MNLCILQSSRIMFNLEEAAQLCCLVLYGIRSCHFSSLNMESVFMKQQILKSGVQRERHHGMCVRIMFGIHVDRCTVKWALIIAFQALPYMKNWHCIIQNTINLTSKTGKMRTPSLETKEKGTGCSLCGSLLEIIKVKEKNKSLFGANCPLTCYVSPQR